MKNFWKILAALMVVALPFAVASCGGDDEDPDAPKTYTYKWSLVDTTPGSSATTAEKAAALAAETAVNKLLAAEFTKQGFTVDANAQEFSVTTTNDPDSYDNKVRAGFYSVKASTLYITTVEALPSASKITIKRGSTVIVNEKLQ